jgi:hypothetical protein
MEIKGVYMPKYGKKAGTEVKKAMHERKKRHLEKWQVWEKGDAPQAGCCDWSFKSSKIGRKGAAQEILHLAQLKVADKENSLARLFSLSQ